MAAGLRLTGTVELAGLRAPPDWRRAWALLPLAQRLYPGLAPEGAAEHSAVWMGHRPSMPDSLPVIGRSRRCADVVYAFGHGHLGLTGAPFTGRLVAELVGGRPPAIDLRPYAPARFA
jgi:D-amino-acid dehydrogenase